MSSIKDSSSIETASTKVMSPALLSQAPKRYNFVKEPMCEIYHFRPESCFSATYSLENWGRRSPRRPYIILNEGKEVVARAGRPDGSPAWRICVGEYDEDVDIVEQSEVLILEEKTFSFGFTLPNGQRKVCAWEKSKSLLHHKDMKLVEEKGNGTVLASFKAGPLSSGGTLDINIDWGAEFEHMLLIGLACVWLRKRAGQLGGTPVTHMQIAGSVGGAF